MALLGAVLGWGLRGRDQVGCGRGGKQGGSAGGGSAEPELQQRIGFQRRGGKGAGRAAWGAGRSLGPQAEPLVQRRGGGLAVEIRGASRKPQRSRVGLRGAERELGAGGALGAL